MKISQIRFEVQRKSGQRADNPGSVESPSCYPCFVLNYNYDWNDYGYSNWYALFYFPSPNEYMLIGELKLMTRMEGDAYQYIRGGFNNLSDDYCSIGLEMIYYENLHRYFGVEDAKNIYTQEINIFQQSAIDKFNSAMDINTNYIKEQKEKSIMFFKIVIGIMSALLVFGEICIIITAKISKKARAEISEKQKQAESANKKFKRSQEKIKDIVYKNILTGMKNRYALEKDIGERLQSEPFNMALFDMDNFRSINDTYGYDFGDEYLVQIAEKLQKSFGEYAEIYNITGNEFFVLFNSDISKEKSINLSKNIFTAIGMAYSVGNIGIQLSVSGCAYNYLPGDCSSLDSLLVKMNNTIRNIKKNGGNSMASVTNI